MSKEIDFYKNTKVLNDFEAKYKFLYYQIINGVTLYTCLRDDVLLRLQGGQQQQSDSTAKGRIYPRRILDGIVKMYRLRNAKTLIFTSAVYRRDHGRNLAAEYLMEEYPDAVVFEWPARNDVFDSSYFGDPHRDKYCPLDFYLVLYKIKRVLYQRTLRDKEEIVRTELKDKFKATDHNINETERAAIDYIIEQLPASYVATELSQAIFRKLFAKYKNVKYAIDYWGSGRENIFPVLHGNPEKIELQHGIITKTHPGYIYPDFVRDIGADFFMRTMLVYGEATKDILVNYSIFINEQIQIIDNPRIKTYKKEFSNIENNAKKYILFTSQPYEQDGKGVNYYSTIIPILREIKCFINYDNVLKDYTFAIKLHPREDSGVVNIYHRALPEMEIFDNSTDLFHLLNSSYIHLTANSTTLFEAAEFGVPTAMIAYSGYTDTDVYGFHVKTIHDITEVAPVMKSIVSDYDTYTDYLRSQTRKYM